MGLGVWGNPKVGRLEEYIDNEKRTPRSWEFSYSGITLIGGISLKI
jgi:hypothetical protein